MSFWSFIILKYFLFQIFNSALYSKILVPNFLNINFIVAYFLSKSSVLSHLSCNNWCENSYNHYLICQTLLHLLSYLTTQTILSDKILPRNGGNRQSMFWWRSANIIDGWFKFFPVMWTSFMICVQISNSTIHWAMAFPGVYVFKFIWDNKAEDCYVCMPIFWRKKCWQLGIKKCMECVMEDDAVQKSYSQLFLWFSFFLSL